MDTITFRATPKDGNIQIPLQYRQDLQNTDTVEVVLHKVVPTSEGSEANIAAGWEQLMQLVEENTMDAGIEDLAHQHDHYLHGKPKQS